MSQTIGVQVSLVTVALDWQQFLLGTKCDVCLVRNQRTREIKLLNWCERKEWLRSILRATWTSSLLLLSHLSKTKHKCEPHADVADVRPLGAEKEKDVEIEQ